MNVATTQGPKLEATVYSAFMIRRSLATTATILMTIYWIATERPVGVLLLLPLAAFALWNGLRSRRAARIRA